MKSWLNGLSARIIVLLVSTLVLAGVLIGVFAWRVVETGARRETAQSLARQADIAAAVIGGSSTTNLASQLRELRTVKTAVAWRGDSGALSGDLLARNADEQAGHPAGPVTTWVRIEGRDVAVAVRPLPGTGRTLVLASAFTLSDTAAWSMATQVVLGATLALVAAVIAAMLLARRVMRPLRAAASAAEQLAAGHREVRIEPGGPTEVRELAETVNQLADALSASEGRQRRFLMSVSHELRTPLTALLGYGESLADGVIAGDAAVRAAGTTIVNESSRLHRLVDDLLALSRLAADEFRVERAPVALGPFVGEVREVWSRRCRAEGIDFAATTPDGELMTDAARLRQVLDNLLENALRVTPSSGAIALTVDAGPDLVEFAVRDTGPGLSADDLAHAFDEGVLWERYRGVRRVGTGLGLALVRRLATALDGQVQAISDERTGSTFIVSIPRD